MTVTLPTTQGIVDKVLDALVDYLTLKLQTEIGETDASRLTTIKVGPLQDSPTRVNVLVHENDPDNPNQWPHAPIRYREQRSTGELVGTPRTFGTEGAGAMLRHAAGMDLIGGGSRMHRAFSLELIVWGLEFQSDIPTIARRDVGQLAAIIENRIIRALKQAGPKIGSGSAITDDFGEMVHDGPYLGEGWTEYEEGEGLQVRKRIRFYYITQVDWSTDAW